jgi:hypothetical protein
MTRLSVAVVGVVVAAFSTTFVVGSTPDEEEFRFAVLSSWLHVSALRHGNLEFWTDLLGLGVPQPFTPNFLLHPLLPLLTVVSPVTWTRVLLLAHTVLGAAGMWWLTRHMRVTTLTSAVCVSTFVLATPSQNYILIDFWPSHYIVWTSAPWLLLLAWRLLEAEGRDLRVASVACGLCAGLVIACANPGHLIAYLPVAAAVVVAHWRQAVLRRRWIALATLIAMAIASPTIVQVARELAMFDRDLGVDRLLDPLPWSAAWNAFLSPLGPPTEPRDFARALYFGGPFAVLCLIGCVQFGRRHADLVLVVVTCTIVLFTSVWVLPLMSARFHLRDPLILAAIPLAGLSFERLLSARRWRPVAVLVAITQLAVLCASAWPAMARTWTDGRQAAWFRAGTGATEPVEALLRLARPVGRIVFSPEVDAELNGEGYGLSGVGINALAYRGLPVVNGWFKGVSTGTVWPDNRRFYGRVNTPPQLLESATTLDVLGIRYLLAGADEPVSRDLLRRGAVPKTNGTRFELYENNDAWPAAFVVDSAAESLPATRLPGCSNDSVLCADLTSLAERRSPDRLLITNRNGWFDLQLSPTDEPRLLVVTQMFRPDWFASADGDPLITVPVLGGLVGVRIPAGTRSVQLRYRPATMVLATALAWCTLIASLVALIVLCRTGRRSAPISSPTSDAS